MMNNEHFETDPGLVLRCFEGALKIFDIPPQLSILHDTLMEMCEGDSEDEDVLRLPPIEQYCGRATFIEEQTMKLYLCTDPDDSEITAQMGFDKLDHNLMEASVEPDCVNLWQWFID